MDHLGHTVTNDSSKRGEIEERNKNKNYLNQIILIIQIGLLVLSSWVPATVLGARHIATS